LWGYGGIGREIARLAKALGLTVHVLTRSGVKPRRDDFTPPGTGDPDGVLPDRVFRQGVDDREFLASLDFLILALPRAKTTTGLIGEAELRALPKTAFVTESCSRPDHSGGGAPASAARGLDRRAALDTHYYYPMPPDHPLWAFPNVIMTPHISGADKSNRFPTLMGELCVENVTRHREGRPLLNVVSRQDLNDV